MNDQRVNITEVTVAGATTLSYPARSRDSAEQKWEAIIADPRTEYAQWVEGATITRRHLPTSAV